MICVKVDISKELSTIDDELKAIYHSKDSVFFLSLRIEKNVTINCLSRISNLNENWFNNL